LLHTKRRVFLLCLWLKNRDIIEAFKKPKVPLWKWIAYTLTHMKRRLWRRINCHVNTARCSALKLILRHKLHICMHSPKFQFRLNVIMRPSRMNISGSFVKTFFTSWVSSETINFFSFYSIRLYSIYFHSSSAICLQALEVYEVFFYIWGLSD